MINAPIKAYNLYLPTGDYLSPLSDFSPLTLYFPSPNGYNTQSCPVNTTDVLRFTVTNPQSGAGLTPLCVLVGSTGGSQTCTGEFP